MYGLEVEQEIYHQRVKGQMALALERRGPVSDVSVKYQGVLVHRLRISLF